MLSQSLSATILFTIDNGVPDTARGRENQYVEYIISARPLICEGDAPRSRGPNLVHGSRRDLSINYPTS